MRRAAWVLAILLAGHAASAQQAGDSLNDTQRLGAQLFHQACVICHVKPQITAAVYGPALSRDSLGGQETVMRDVIRAGTPRMPGFQHHFTPAQIDAIVAFMKTLPPVQAGTPR
jgi:mono/diheme cytochrome c family protein